ncbi:Piso0_004855 [Millerozyma farinosa CBS 7064]|uniref:Transcriptional protein SWT1 n=1 Tax=Pichia sorbitophila (strain ATCC MYA-4447 / BCRC 22081 / CBS 7064 / NBRC 10061 / NRRL Y-12695) TaxID=559304 RepID=G8Y3K4_PICSO|nr:Piso0_004855 [Millerozyma farinosa CBS 7064]
MSLPSKHAPEGLDPSYHSRVITVGGRNLKDGGTTEQEGITRDKSPDLVKDSNQTIEDIDMATGDEYNEINLISDFVNERRDINDLDYSDPMDIEDNDKVDINKIDSRSIFLIIDTNFVLSHLDILIDLERISADYNMLTIIPIAVMKELDGLKNSERQTVEKIDSVNVERSLGQLARRANDWIYSMLADKSSTVRGQKVSQRIDRAAVKDDAILDCCLYFQQAYTDSIIILFSNDKNFCLKALSNDILTVSYRKGINAKLIASKIYQERISTPPSSEFHEDPSKTTYSIENTSTINEPTTTTNSVHNEIQSLLISVIHHCMQSNYGEDLDLVKGYEKSSLTSMKDAVDVIKRFWFPVFSHYFKPEKIKFFEEKESNSKPQRSVLTQVPGDKTELSEFVNFWSNVLHRLYDAEMLPQQKEALDILIDRWYKLI